MRHFFTKPIDNRAFSVMAKKTSVIFALAIVFFHLLLPYAFADDRGNYKSLEGMAKEIVQGPATPFILAYKQYDDPSKGNVYYKALHLALSDIKVVTEVSYAKERKAHDPLINKPYEMVQIAEDSGLYEETNKTTYTEFTGAMATLNGFSTFIKLMAVLIVLLISIVRAADALSKDADLAETLLKHLCYVAFTAAIIFFTDRLISAVCNLGSTISQYAANILLNTQVAKNLEDTKVVLDGDENIASAAAEYLWQIAGIKNKVGFIKYVTTVITLIIPKIIANIANVAGAFLFVQILIEIMLHRVFAPLAITDIFYEGYRSNGMRWIKKCFALSLTFSVYIIIAILSAYLMSVLGAQGATSQGDGILGPLWLRIIVSVSTIGAMFKGSSFADKIVGA